MAGLSRPSRQGPRACCARCCQARTPPRLRCTGHSGVRRKTQAVLKRAFRTEGFDRRCRHGDRIWCLRAGMRISTRCAVSSIRCREHSSFVSWEFSVPFVPTPPSFASTLLWCHQSSSRDHCCCRYCFSSSALRLFTFEILFFFFLSWAGGSLNASPTSLWVRVTGGFWIPRWLEPIPTRLMPVYVEARAPTGPDSRLRGGASYTTRLGVPVPTLDAPVGRCAVLSCVLCHPLARVVHMLLLRHAPTRAV